ncbi:hypothetical protein G8764_12880 [Pseudomaricurvus alcaniphilus]|uniref:hypothetical protein n=1 Tax=Pseudomaricurvus alcaniphilus TaxID=1166482 RepID=UPI00140D8CAB|nr:hypothetical protein [Pseudomaricurvus alcaniphilus]NHN38195.1 hypothetical protein [Pseudomaricurvus alcaniphilus]
MNNRRVIFCRTIIFFMTILCVACSSEKAGLRELKKLCEKDAGLTVYKTVEADGYYDGAQAGGALRVLVPSKFSFVEYCELAPNVASLFQEAGCWRLTKIARDTGSCSEVIDNILWGSGLSGYVDYRENNCILVDKLVKPMAKYAFNSSVKEWLGDDQVSGFRRVESYVENFSTSELMGRYVSYSYSLKPGYAITKYCQNIDKKYLTYEEARLIESVIKPRMEVSINSGDMGHDR